MHYPGKNTITRQAAATLLLSLFYSSLRSVATAGIARPDCEPLSIPGGRRAPNILNRKFTRQRGGTQVHGQAAGSHLGNGEVVRRLAHGTYALAGASRSDYAGHGGPTLQACLQAREVRQIGV